MSIDALSHTWTLTKARMRLAMHNRAFFFFSLVMPLVFLFGALFISGRRTGEWVAYVLGAIITLTVMGSFWGLSVQLVTFREQGILRRFRLTPAGAGPMLASSILSNYFLMLPSVAIEIVVCRLAFHLHAWGNLPAVFILISFGSATFSAFGLIVASVTNTMQETQIINQLIWMAFLLLSGASVPLAVFPLWIQRFALFMPATYLATGLEAATTNLITRGEVITDVVALAIGLLVAFEVSRQLFRWEPEARVSGRAKIWVVVAMVPFLVFGIWENAKGGRLVRVQQDYQMLTGRMGSAQPPRDR